MRITWDKQAHALYIELLDLPRGRDGSTEELVPDTVMIDKTALQQISGIEILGVDSIEEI